MALSVFPNYNDTASFISKFNRQKFWPVITTWVRLLWTNMSDLWSHLSIVSHFQYKNTFLKGRQIHSEIFDFEIVDFFNKFNKTKKWEAIRIVQEKMCKLQKNIISEMLYDFKGV